MPSTRSSPEPDEPGGDRDPDARSEELDVAAREQRGREGSASVGCSSPGGLHSAIVDRQVDFCLRRSQVELLRDHYAESPAVQAIVADDVERADRELRRVGAEQPEPLPARLVPDGLPASHWWWRHP